MLEFKKNYKNLLSINIFLKFCILKKSGFLSLEYLKPILTFFSFLIDKYFKNAFLLILFKIT